MNNLNEVKISELVCPPLRMLRSVEFNEKLARAIVALNLPGDGTLDWVLNRVYDDFSGSLIDYNGKKIELDDRFIDEDFSHTDTRRRVNAYKERATKKFRQRLSIKMADRVMWMWFALQIHRMLNDE